MESHFSVPTAATTAVNLNRYRLTGRSQLLPKEKVIPMPEFLEGRERVGGASNASIRRLLAKKRRELLGERSSSESDDDEDGHTLVPKLSLTALLKQWKLKAARMAQRSSGKKKLFANYHALAATDSPTQEQLETMHEAVSIATSDREALRNFPLGTANRKWADPHLHKLEDWFVKGDDPSWHSTQGFVPVMPKKEIYQGDLVASMNVMTASGGRGGGLKLSEKTAAQKSRAESDDILAPKLPQTEGFAPTEDQLDTLVADFVAYLGKVLNVKKLTISHLPLLYFPDRAKHQAAKIVKRAEKEEKTNQLLSATTSTTTASNQQHHHQQPLSSNGVASTLVSLPQTGTAAGGGSGSGDHPSSNQTAKGLKSAAAATFLPAESGGGESPHSDRKFPVDERAEKREMHLASLMRTEQALNFDPTVYARLYSVLFRGVSTTFSRITELALPACDLTDGCALIISEWLQGAAGLGGEASGIPLFTKLDLSDNCIGALGTEALAIALKTNSRLDTLILHGNPLYDAAEFALQEMLTYSIYLKHLDLGFCRFTSEIARSLFKALGVSRLKFLSLEGMRMTSQASLLLLASITHNRSLTGLNLKFNHSCSSKQFNERLEVCFTRNKYLAQHGGGGTHGRLTAGGGFNSSIASDAALMSHMRQGNASTRTSVNTAGGGGGGATGADFNNLMDSLARGGGKGKGLGISALEFSRTTGMDVSGLDGFDEEGDTGALPYGYGKYTTNEPVGCNAPWKPRPPALRLAGGGGFDGSRRSSISSSGASGPSAATTSRQSSRPSGSLGDGVFTSFKGLGGSGLGGNLPSNGVTKLPTSGLPPIPPKTSRF